MRHYFVSTMVKETQQEYFLHRESSMDGNRQGPSSEKYAIVIQELTFLALRKWSYLSYIYDRYD